MAEAINRAYRTLSTKQRYLINSILVVAFLAIGELMISGGVISRYQTTVLEQVGIYIIMAVSLNIATGSQANIKAAYSSGTPAFGVGAGNVAGIVDETANVDAAAERVLRGKSAVGVIQIAARAEGNLVVVEIADDGRGVDVKKLRERLVAACFDRRLESERRL